MSEPIAPEVIAELNKFTQGKTVASIRPFMFGGVMVVFTDGTHLQILPRATDSVLRDANVALHFRTASMTFDVAGSMRKLDRLRQKPEGDYPSTGLTWGDPEDRD